MARTQAGTRTTAGTRTSLPNPIILSDTFSSNTLSNYTNSTVVNGTWVIGSGILTQSVAGSGAGWAAGVLLTNGSSYTNFDLYCDIQKPAGNIQVVFRSGITANSGYGLQIRDTANLRIENWGQTNLIQTTNPHGLANWSTSQWYTIHVHIQGNYIQASIYLQGTTEPTTYDLNFYNSLFSTGSIGFSVENGAGGNFDNLIVLNLNRRFQA